MNDLPDSVALPGEANLIEQKLIALVRRAAAAMPHAAGANNAPLDLTISLRLDPAKNWNPAPPHTPLLRQVQDALEERAIALDAFQRGRVYCYRSRTAWCAEAVPPRPTAIFAGYSPTGMPIWKDLHQYLLDAGDERVDALFAAPPRVLSRSALGRDVKRAMLPELGKASRSYNILGQVVAGYFAAPSSDDPRDTMAITLQFIECRGAGGVFRLELNIIGVAPDGVAASTLYDYGALPALERACRPVERELKHIECLVRQLPREAPPAERTRLLGRVPALLTRLAGLLEQDAVQAVRRTRHAVQRRADARPVQCATEDVRSAPADRFLWDEVHHTWIVRGPRGRVHIFSSEARHVTSFNLRIDQVERRIRTRMWRPATPDETARFRASFEAVMQALPGA